MPGWQTNGARFPSSGYLGSEKYYVAKPGLASGGGGTLPLDSVDYENRNDLTVTMREIDKAGARLGGCGGCATTEMGGECTMRVQLSAVPQYPVRFRARVESTLDSLNNGDARYEAKISYGTSEVIEAEYIIEPKEWASGAMVTLRGMDDAIYEVNEYYSNAGAAPFEVIFFDFSSEDPEFDAVLNNGGDEVFNCSMLNMDDETGGFLVTQGGEVPSGKRVTSVDENGAFGVVHITAQAPPGAPMYIPVYVPETGGGLVNVTGTTLVDCPASAFATISDTVNNASVRAVREWPANARCLEFTVDGYDIPQAVTYWGVDDGGVNSQLNPGGSTPFRVNFGPSASNDVNFAGLKDLVIGKVMDNDALQISKTTCSTWEGGTSTEQNCQFSLTYDAGFFFGSGDAARESSARKFKVVLSSSTDEGVFSATRALSVTGAEGLEITRLGDQVRGAC